MEIWKYSILVFLGGCSYGVVSTFVKLAYGSGFTAGDITGSQYLVGAVIGWLVSGFVPRIKLTAKQVLLLLVSGIPMGLTGIFYNQSLEHVHASFAVILLMQYIWIYQGLQYLFEKKTPGISNTVSIAVIFLGSLLASDVFKSSGEFSWVGIGWGLLSALSFASFVYVSSYNSIPIHPVYKSTIMTTGAGLLVMLIMPPVFLVNGALTAGLFKYAVLTALFGSIFPPILFSIGMPNVRNLGNILCASELPMAVGMSALVLGEAVNSFRWLGVIIILFGIAYPQLARRRLPLT